MKHFVNVLKGNMLSILVAIVFLFLASMFVSIIAGILFLLGYWGFYYFSNKVDDFNRHAYLGNIFAGCQFFCSAMCLCACGLGCNALNWETASLMLIFFSLLVAFGGVIMLLLGGITFIFRKVRGIKTPDR